MTSIAGRHAARRTKETVRVGDDYLSVHQEAYCRARAMGMTAKDALAFIGSPVKIGTVQGWEKNDQKIRDRIEKLSLMATEHAIQQTGLTREWVISRLMNVVERCMQAEPVLDSKGSPTGTFEFNATGANNALKLLGDTMGLFKPAEKKPEDEYASLSDDDLRRIAAELASQTGLIALSAPDVIDVTPKE